MSIGRYAAAISALNAGQHIILGFATTTGPNDLCGFVSTETDFSDPSTSFDFDLLLENQMYGLYLGLSCDLAAFWSYDGILGLRPVAEALLLAEGKGAIGWFGPTHSTYQNENYSIGKETVARLAPTSPSSVAWICRDALQAVVAADSSAVVRAASYVYLGDPTLTLAWDDAVPTDAPAQPKEPEVWFAVHSNPIRGPMTIEYAATTTRTLVTFRVYDIMGRLVRTLLRESPVGPGRHVLRWDGLDEQGNRAASGLYFGKLDAGSRSVTSKFVVVR